MSEEKELIARARSGDVKAFEELILAYQKIVFNIAVHFTGDYEEARDISQQAFVKVFNSIKSFQGKAAFSTWLYSIVKNVYLDEYKKNYRKELSGRDGNIRLDFDNSILRPDLREADNNTDVDENYREIVKKCLTKVPSKFRFPVILFDIQGFSYAEIAGIYKLPLGTVQSRIYRGRKLLKMIIRKDFGNNI